MTYPCYKKIFRFIFVLSVGMLGFACPVQAQAYHGRETAASRLTEQQFERVKQCARLLMDIKSQSVDGMLTRLEASSDPEANLQILEAIAKTYVRLVSDLKIEKAEDKESLYGRISLNMAFLQMGGVNPAAGESRQPLNRLILRTLRSYLSEALIRNSDLFYTLE